MIEENWKDVTLYNVYVKENKLDIIDSFLFCSEMKNKEIIEILFNYYGSEFKKEQLVIEELEDILQLIK